MTTRKTATHNPAISARLLLVMSLDPKEIGGRIAAARDRQGWTQMDLANEANVSMSTVARWESGKLPPVRELIRVAEVLGVEPDYLVEGAPQYQQEDTPSALLRSTADGVTEILHHLVRIERHLGLPEGDAESPRTGTSL